MYSSPSSPLYFSVQSSFQSPLLCCKALRLVASAVSYCPIYSPLYCSVLYFIQLFQLSCTVLCKVLCLVASTVSYCPLYSPLYCSVL